MMVAGNGGGYLAQARELEMLRRDNHRMVGELANRDAVLDHLRNELNMAAGTIRQMSGLLRYHVRTAFMLGLGIGVVVVMVFGWMVMWLK